MTTVEVAEPPNHSRTRVSTFAVDRHRRRNDEFLDLRPACEYRFEQNSRTEIVRTNVSLYLIHRLAHANFSRFVKNYVDPFERRIHYARDRKYRPE